MLIHFGLFLFCLSCVSSERLNSGYLRLEPHDRFSLWPSMHNAATLMRIRRESQAVGNVGPSEGVPVLSEDKKPLTTEHVEQQVDKNINTTKLAKNETSVLKPEQISNTDAANSTEVHLANNVNSTVSNATLVEKTVKQLDFNNPGVVKRGLIVFGGFALMAIAYFVFYRRKNKNSEQNNSSIDPNQFRYGVLQSEDKRDTELSRVPLTMESDDEEDEDLEIFDLEQKKKSLSYVNLQTNDEDIVLSPKDSNVERDNLLLDIEDANSDQLINWSGNGSRSIL